MTKPKAKMTSVIVVPKVSETLSKMPSGGRSATEKPNVVCLLSPSSSNTVRVTVQSPGGRFCIVQVGPVWSVSPTVSPSPSKSKWLLSQRYTRLALSPSVSTDSKADNVRLSPSIRSTSSVSRLITGVGGRLITLMLVEALATAPSSSITFTVTHRTPRVDHDVDRTFPSSSQSLLLTPSLSLSSVLSRSQQMRRLARSEAVSSAVTVRFSTSSSNTGSETGSCETLGGTLCTLM